MNNKRPLYPVAVNTAEAIIDPFWDPQLSGLQDWRITPGARYGLTVCQEWCQVRAEWVSPPASGPVLRMRLGRRIPCTTYDRLVWVVSAPPQSTVILEAQTDAGHRSISRKASKSGKTEVVLALRGARELQSVQLEIVPGADGAATATLLWVGMRNAKRLREYLERWRTPPPIPEKHLRPLPDLRKAPVKDRAAWLPVYGITLSADALRRQRRDQERIRWAEAIRRRAASFVPETLCNECLVVAGYMDNRYNRVDHHQRPVSMQAVELGLAGLLLKDPKLLHMAARTALAKAMSPVWEENTLCDYPGGIWEHRAFNHTALLEDLAAALDLAGSAFSEAGRDYLLRRMAEEGLGRANFIAWKHEYIYHNNQLAAFSPGRVAAYAVLERHWPRVRPYLDQALRELNDNFEHILLPDGGYAEGPGYFAYGVGWGLRALEIAARARNLPLAGIVPERLRKTSNMATCLGSTDDACTFIPFGDAVPDMDAATCEWFAAFAPDGGWDWLARRARAREDGKPLPEIEWPPFIRLPDMGVLASHRRLKGHWVKLFVAGCVRDADHNHEDKGGFVLEYAGETLALDPGVRRYQGTPEGALLKHVDFHNMLVPYGDFSERPHPQLPHPDQPWDAGIVPEGEGDGTTLHARVDATRGYEAYFHKWVRQYQSPTPDELIIRDDYSLKQGHGVDFLWQTHQAVEIKANRVIVRGQRSMATITIPKDCKPEVEIAARELSQAGTSPVIQRRIRIRRPGRRGTLIVHVQITDQSIQ